MTTARGWGRFITVDPIKAGFNWYEYCGNDPVSFADPTGLAPRNLTEAQRDAYKEYVQNVTPAGIPNSYDCADVGLYIYSEATEAATGKANAYTNVNKNSTPLSNLQNIQASDTFGANNQKNGDSGLKTGYTRQEGARFCRFIRGERVPLHVRRGHGSTWGVSSGSNRGYLDHR